MAADLILSTLVTHGMPRQTTILILVQNTYGLQFSELISVTVECHVRQLEQTHIREAAKRNPSGACTFKLLIYA
jgi:hypothetical protein